MPPFYERMPGINLPNVTASRCCRRCLGGCGGRHGAHLVGNIAKGRIGKKEEGGELNLKIVVDPVTRVKGI